MDMKKSTTGDSSSSSKEPSQLKTRTSKNTRVGREASSIIDTIYRRAADLERIDEALLRYRDDDERPDVPGPNSLAEQLQLVHYGVSEEYTCVTSLFVRTCFRPFMTHRVVSCCVQHQKCAPRFWLCASRG